MAAEPETPSAGVKPTAAPADAPVVLVPADKPAGPSAAPAAAKPSDEPPKKKKKTPGTPPRRGKKLRNQVRSAEQKVRAAGAVPIKQAVTLLKGLKRAKFDET